VSLVVFSLLQCLLAQIPDICRGANAPDALCDCAYSRTDPLRNCFNGIPDPYETMPVNLTIALFGDQGLGSNSRAVLNLILNEGAEAALHVGDFDYVNDPVGWDNQINAVLGPDFPYFSVIGNHDLPRWTGYSNLIRARYNRFGAKCWGDIGRDVVCSYKGVVFAQSGVGTSSNFDETFLAEALEAFPSAVPICGWHKNQHNMQLGSKTDETGYGVYQTCGALGAFIVTGHEHSYSRTKSMLGYGPTPRWENVPNDELTGDQLVLEDGRSAAVVAGVGGVGLRVCTGGKEYNGWWGSALCTNGSPRLTSYGTLICKFNFKGNADQAYCELKMIDGTTMDNFLLISNHGFKGTKSIIN